MTGPLEHEARAHTCGASNALSRGETRIAPCVAALHTGRYTDWWRGAYFRTVMRRHRDGRGALGACALVCSALASRVGASS